jgi:LysM repeat protein
MSVTMKKIKILTSIALISVLSISCTQKKTGPLVYKGKEGQPYGDPYASAEEYNNVYTSQSGGGDDFYSQPVGDPYVPPGSGDIAIQPPSPQPNKTYASKQSVHTVKKGDTLYSISRNYGTTVATLRQVNGISGSLIRIGERISIP